LERHRSNGGKRLYEKYVEERELTVLLLVDVSASGGFGSVSGKSKREVAAEVASLLAFCAIRITTRLVCCSLPTRPSFTYRQREDEPIPSDYPRDLFFEPKGRGTDLAQPLEFINRVTTRRAVIFLLSDFQANGFERPLSICARKHDLIAVPIEDPATGTCLRSEL